jgi:hypothetical protein
MFLFEGKEYESFGALADEFLRALSMPFHQIEGKYLEVKYRRANGEVVPVAEFFFSDGQWHGTVEKG